MLAQTEITTLGIEYATLIVLGENTPTHNVPLSIFQVQCVALKRVLLKQTTLTAIGDYYKGLIICAARRTPNAEPGVLYRSSVRGSHLLNNGVEKASGGRVPYGVAGRFCNCFTDAVLRSVLVGVRAASCRKWHVKHTELNKNLDRFKSTVKGDKPVKVVECDDSSQRVSPCSQK